MPTVVAITSPEGLHLSADTLREAGVEPGGLVELVALPGPEEIVYRALAHCVRNLGDALGARDPVWDDSERMWQVGLVEPGGKQVIGSLYFTAHGELVPDRSSTFDSLMAAYDAARAQDPAA
jgi:hypothetical protein